MNFKKTKLTKEDINTLRKIKHICNTTQCKDCIFDDGDDDGGCMFMSYDSKDWLVDTIEQKAGV